MVSPKEVLESFPNEGKHESVPRVKHTEVQSTTDLSRVQWRGGAQRAQEMLDCGDLVLQG